MTPIYYVPEDDYDVRVYRQGAHIIILDQFDQDVTERYSVTDGETVLIKLLR